MIGLLLTSVIVFLTTTLFGHLTHWSLHQKFAGRFNKSHMTHHLELYPITDYKSDSYRDPGKDSTVKTFAMAAVPLLAAPILLCVFGKLSIFLAAWSVIEMLAVGLLHDRIHDSFHLNKTLWRFCPGYERWAKLHYLHHVDMQKNFGIFTFFWDRLFRTLKTE